jgi:hypothetical protein
MKKIILLLFALIITVSVSYAELDYVPKITVLEQFVSSLDDNTMESYMGVRALQERYHQGEVLTIRYFTGQEGGAHSSQSVEGMFELYDVKNLPTTIVNGNQKIYDSRSEVVWGYPYISMVQREYYKPSPLKIHSLSFNKETGNVTVSVDMLSASKSINKGSIRFILVENFVADSITDVGREVINEPFSLSGQGNTAQFARKFTIDPSWDIDNLFVIVCIADDSGYIEQAASTYETPQYGYIRPVIANQRVDFGNSSDSAEQPFFAVFNMGETDDLGLRVEMEGESDGWFVTYCDEESCFFGPCEFTLEKGKAKQFHANIMPSTPGMLHYQFIITSSNGSEYFIPLVFITTDVDYLIIDGDGGTSKEWFTTSILEKNEDTFGVWDINYAELNSAIGQYWNKLIWVTGDRQPALSSNDTIFLKSYLGKKNSLFITGNNIAADLVLSEYNSNVPFYNEYLAANILKELTGERIVVGIDDDPISEGFDIEIEDGNTNQPGPEVIEPIGDRSSIIFKYRNGDIAGIRTILGSDARVVYTSFGFELIESEEAQEELLYRVMNWFEATGIDENQTQIPVIVKSELYPSYPNPFSISKEVQATNNRSVTTGITIPYYMDRSENANSTLTIYNIKGQKIREFPLTTTLGGEKGIVVWDAKDSLGNTVVSGVYFSILSSMKESKAQKMLIVK